MAITLRDYTMIIYRLDRRTTAGKRKIGTYEYQQKHARWMAEEKRDLQTTLYPEGKYEIEVVHTYVTKKNLMTGVEYLERFDTPYSCSPSSESFWSN